MAKPAFNYDNTLDEFERYVQVEKCIKNLAPHIDRMNEKEAAFVEKMTNTLRIFIPSMNQIAWLRDLCEKYDR